jgi:nucleotide-binding universal stress UspA family protein
VVQDRKQLIVVGVDGSAGSVEALRWALSEARSTGAEVRVVVAWDMPATYGYAPTYDDVDWAATARKAVDHAVNEATDGTPPTDLSVQVVQGHAANVLVDASREADLLVVGSRGHGTAVGMLLGSVGHHCVQHARCPVVVVRRRPQ